MCHLAHNDIEIALTLIEFRIKLIQEIWFISDISNKIEFCIDSLLQWFWRVFGHRNVRNKSILQR